MGNNNSHMKSEKSKQSNSKLTPKQLSEFEQNPSENEENELAYYLSNNDFNDIDRQHMNKFIIKYLFQSNFSAPVEEILTRGCKVLDIA